MVPRLLKASAVYGAHLCFRDVCEDDAEFTLNLRSDPAKGRHLSTTSPNLDDQIRWIRGYASHADQAYFIICDSLGRRVGCVRMYDPDERSYSWGSWLLIDGLSPFVAMESVLMVYAYGRFLGFEDARIDVRNDNTAVWKFHERFSGAELVRQGEVDRSYVVKRAAIDALLARYPQLVSDPLRVDPIERT